MPADAMRCERCGQSHTRCSGHRKHRDEQGNLVPCGGMPIKGHTVCRMHSNGVTKAKAQRNVAEAKARQTAAAAIVAYEGQVDGDPLKNLLNMVRRAAAAERAYAMLIEYELGSGKCPTCFRPRLDTPCEHCKSSAAVKEGSILIRTGSHATGFRDEPHPYIKLWNEERDRLARFSKLALDARVTERQLEVLTEEAEVVVNVIIAVARDMGMDETQARISAAKHLSVAAGS